MKVENNLLFVAATKVKRLKLHKYMWSAMGLAYESHQKFLVLVQRTDERGYNVLQLAVVHNKLEIMQWIFAKLNRDVFINDQQLGKFFAHISPKDGKNILQLAAQHNEDPLVHEWLWKTANERLEKNEFRQLIEHADSSDRNVFHLAALHNTNAVFERLYRLAKQYLGVSEMRKVLRKKELIYDENVFDIAKQRARDVTIHTWLKTKRHKYF